MKIKSSKSRIQIKIPFISVSKPHLKTVTVKKNLAEINIEVFQAEIPSSTSGQMENQYTEEWSTEAVANFRL